MLSQWSMNYINRKFSSNSLHLVTIITEHIKRLIMKTRRHNMFKLCKINFYYVYYGQQRLYTLRSKVLSNSSGPFSQHPKRLHDKLLTIHKLGSWFSTHIPIPSTLDTSSSLVVSATAVFGDLIEVLST